MVRLATWLGLWLLALPALAAPSWHYVVRFPANPADPVKVEWTIAGQAGPLRVCSNRDGGGRYVRELRQAAKKLRPTKDDADCWVATPPKEGPLRLTYRVDLAAQARDSGDPDRATLVNGTYLFEEDAVLLRPAPRPEGSYTVEFQLPAGVDVEAPWEPLAKATSFRTSWEQFEWGSYVAVGPLRRLGDVPVRGGAFALTLIGALGSVTEDTLRLWIRHAGTNVATFYEGLPAPRIETLLVAQDCRDRAGVFGTALRHERPSVALFFCANGPAEAFATDWMPTHELFHLGNPMLAQRVPWFTEGVATYYQDVLRARSGQRTAADMWGDLYDGFRRFCAPEDGLSLDEESRALRERHRYRRVYWGAACLFFRLDVAIRTRSHGARSLDTVLRELLRTSRESRLDESALVAALDEAAGEPLARTFLPSKTPAELDDVYRALGIEPVGDDVVRLHEDAPLAGVRKQIF